MNTNGPDINHPMMLLWVFLLVGAKRLVKFLQLRSTDDWRVKSYCIHGYLKLLIFKDKSKIYKFLNSEKYKKIDQRCSTKKIAKTKNY